MYQRRIGFPSCAAFCRAAQMSLLGIHGTCSQRASPSRGLMSRCSSANFSAGNVFADFSYAPISEGSNTRMGRLKVNRVDSISVCLFRTVADAST
jgi:hypothetical protein